MISSDIMRGYHDVMILFLLLEKPSYGYQISRQIREKTKEAYIIKETTLYSAFSRLEKAGYISSFYGTETNGKQRTYYRITESGRSLYYEKCREWERTKEIISCFIPYHFNKKLCLDKNTYKTF